jgi:hypothetical protein
MKNWILWLIPVALAVALTLAWSEWKSLGEEQSRLETELANAVHDSHRAYYDEEAEVAIWELEGLLEFLEHYSAMTQEGPNRGRYYLFLTHGRLSKLFAQSGHTGEAEMHAELAISNAVDFPMVTNMGTLSDAIERLDSTSRPE